MKPRKPHARIRRTEKDTGLESDLQELLALAQGQDISLDTLVKSFSVCEYALLVVLFSFPLCIPGLSFVAAFLSYVLVFMSVFMVLDRPIWLPRWLRAKAIPYDKYEMILQKLMRWVGPLERRFKQRLTVLTGPTAVRVHGASVFVLSAVVCIPLPIIFMNFIAAFPIFLLGLGMLKRDGAVIILAYLATIPCIVAYGLVLVLGVEGMQRLMAWAS